MFVFSKKLITVFLIGVGVLMTGCTHFSDGKQKKCDNLALQQKGRYIESFKIKSIEKTASFPSGTLNREYMTGSDSSFVVSNAVIDSYSDNSWISVGEWLCRPKHWIAIISMLFAFALLFCPSKLGVVCNYFRKIKANVYGFFIAAFFSIFFVFYDLGSWLCSDEAGNLGSFLLAILALVSFFYGPYLMQRWREEKSAEKMSDVAEFGLNNLYTFLEEIKTWLRFSTSWFVYSRFSEENIRKEQMLPEKEKKEFLNNLDIDPYEVRNYCKSGDAILKTLQLAIHRLKRLSDPAVDEKLETLAEHTKKLPTKLFDMHFPNHSEERKAEAAEYLMNASAVIEKSCADIHDLLMNYLMFKNRN